MMEDDIKRWTAKRKAALVMEIIQGKTTVAEASRSFDLPPSDIEEWVDDAKKGMENALRNANRPVKWGNSNSSQSFGTFLSRCWNQENEPILCG
jgi:transposase-like protein